MCPLYNIQEPTEAIAQLQTVVLEENVPSSVIIYLFEGILFRIDYRILGDQAIQVS